MVHPEVPQLGRVWERERLVEDLERGRSLLTITGLSGIGKTWLARACAAEMESIFEGAGGSFFCTLDACSSRDEIERRVVEALGIVDRIPGTLAELLSTRPRTLLILDGAERVVKELAVLLEAAMAQSPKLQVVVTSIIPLGIDGEIIHGLGPLTPDDAVTLFLERAFAAGLSIGEEGRPQVEEIVGRLGRVPLAIELAAARGLPLGELFGGELLAGIDEPLQSAPAELQRQRRGSLDEALSLTWELLSPTEQIALAKTSIFAGSFTLEAATEVLGTEEEAPEILDLLNSLRGKELLAIHEGEPSRFALLEGIRSFAEQKLDEMGWRRELVSKHARSFVVRGERDVARLHGDSSLEALRSLRAERENLLGALADAAEHQPDLAARAGLVLIHLAAIEGPPDAAALLVERAAQAAAASGDPGLIAQTTFELILARGQRIPAQERILALNQALELARGVEDLRLQGRTLVARSAAFEELGEEAEAIAGYQRAARIARTDEDPLIEATALLAQVEVHVGLWEVAAAEARLEELQGIVRTHALQRFGAHAIPSLLGSIMRLRRQFREGRGALQDALACARVEGNSIWEARDHLSLGWLETTAGRLEEAREQIRAALEIWEEHEDPSGRGKALLILGLIRLKGGDEEGATTALSEAAESLGSMATRLWRARALSLLAVAAARRGHIADAARSLREARAFIAERELELDLLALDILEGCVEVAKALALQRKDPSKAEALAAKARGRLEVQGPEEQRGALADALDLLRADLEGWGSEGGVSTGEERLAIAIGAEWFEVPGGERVDLRRRLALRRLLDHLAERRLNQAGVGADPRDLFAVGWPNAQVGAETETKRVYIAIWTLRSLGLGKLLLTGTDGYLLDPSIPLVRPES